MRSCWLCSALLLSLWLSPARLHAQAQPRVGALDAAERALTHGRADQALRMLAPLLKKRLPRALTLAGRIHALQGERVAARQRFEEVVALYNRGAIKDTDGDGLWALAEALASLGAYPDANEIFARAVQASPDNLAIELAWADLFMQKHAVGEAERGVTRVLAEQPEHAGALERMARIALERGQNFAAVEALLLRALRSDPELTAAHVSLAGLALRDEDFALADQRLERALQRNPHDLEALSVRAAVRFSADDEPGFRRAVEAVLHDNPHFSRLYSIVATYAEWEHRYPELVALSEAALLLDPDDAYAHAARGINLLRVGRESEGLSALHEAFRRDHYNTQVFNLLELYEKSLATDYESFDAQPFRLRMAKKERALLAPYAVPLLTRAFTDMSARYHFRPSEPTFVELYEDAEQFSIRATGLPHIGVQGICFGNVLIALSPRAGELNWAQVLWHELSHVFHVQLSQGRVPRWFTEGLAEYETELADAAWKREDDRPLYDALQHERLPALAELNRAFTHAQKPEELMVAYYASALALRYLAERFGFARVVGLLPLWAEGLSTRDVFTRGLGVDLDTLDRDFRAQLKSRLEARYQHDLRIDVADYQDLALWRQRSAAPGARAEDHAGLALALAEAGEYGPATARASALLEEAPREPVARFTLVHVALKRGDVRSARHELDLLLAAGHDGYQLRMLRARIAEVAGDSKLAIVELEAASKLDPERTEAYEALAITASKLGDDALLERALERQAALDQHSEKPLLRLLALRRERGAISELVEPARAGLQRNVHVLELHLALSEGLLARGQRSEARVEAQRALLLAGEPSVAGAAQRLRVTTLLRAIEAQERSARAAPRIEAKPQKAR
jgi:tetratricopeptide (TPR) repeat protein